MTVQNSTMIDRLEMLSHRDELMGEIVAIVHEFFSDAVYEEDKHELILTLCDAVCRNFPVVWN